MSHNTEPGPIDYPATCSVDGCGALTEYCAHGKAWSETTKAAERTEENCARFELGVAVCGAHVEYLQPALIISDEGWQQIVAPFRAMGWPAPLRESIVITAVALPPKAKERAS